MRAGGYIGVSSNMQAENGHRLDMQRKMIGDYPKTCPKTSAWNQSSASPESHALRNSEPLRACREDDVSEGFRAYTFGIAQ